MQKEIKVLFQVEEQDLEAFKESLINNEKSNLIIEKYIRDVRHFLVWLEGREITKAETLAYKAYLSDNYAISSVNSMISSLSAWLKYIGRSECRSAEYRESGKQRKRRCRLAGEGTG